MTGWPPAPENDLAPNVKGTRAEESRANQIQVLGSTANQIIRDSKAIIVLESWWQPMPIQGSTVNGFHSLRHTRDPTVLSRGCPSHEGGKKSPGFKAQLNLGERGCGPEADFLGSLSFIKRLCEAAVLRHKKRRQASLLNGVQRRDPCP